MFVSEIDVRIQILDPGLPLPAYARTGDAGMDLYARESVVLAPFERALVATGIAIELPLGFAAFVHPRSGLAYRKGLTVVNSPGTVDAGYRGEVQVALINLDASSPVHVSRGDRIAQMVVQPISTVNWAVVPHLEGSDRSGGGFGSTGVAGIPVA